MGRLAPGLAVALALAHPTCTQAPHVAPPGSTIVLIANPEFIPANGGVSEIAAIVVEPAGTPVSDGTVVFFFTNLGRIPRQGKTNDGVARVNFVSDSRSGTATIVAQSGGPAVAPSASPTPSPTPTPGTAPVPSPPAAGDDAGSFDAGDAVALAGSADVMNSAQVRVVIGSALPDHVFVTAEPTRIERTDPRESFIVANVFDANGNTVSNVPVFFTIDGAPSTERMVSEGAPRFTDNNGRAEDILRTKYDLNAPQKLVTVTATTANEKAGSVTVAIN